MLAKAEDLPPITETGTWSGVAAPFHGMDKPWTEDEKARLEKALTEIFEIEDEETRKSRITKIDGGVIRTGTIPVWNGPDINAEEIGNLMIPVDKLGKPEIVTKAQIPDLSSLYPLPEADVQIAAGAVTAEKLA